MSQGKGEGEPRWEKVVLLPFCGLRACGPLPFSNMVFVKLPGPQTSLEYLLKVEAP